MQYIDITKIAKQRRKRSQQCFVVNDMKEAGLIVWSKTENEMFFLHEKKNLHKRPNANADMGTKRLDLDWHQC